LSTEALIPSAGLIEKVGASFRSELQSPFQDALDAMPTFRITVFHPTAPYNYRLLGALSHLSRALASELVAPTASRVVGPECID
jgi:hypothetical protein